MYAVYMAAPQALALGDPTGFRAQHQKRYEFETEMTAEKEELNEEIQSRRTEWEQERKRHDAEIKERDAAKGKRREREEEEYLYTFQREQQVAKDQTVAANRESLRSGADDGGESH